MSNKMDVWEKAEIQAPQWIDFSNSPQPSEDYFDHHLDESTLPLQTTLPEAPETLETIRISDMTPNKLFALNKIKMTPIKIITPSAKGKENTAVIKETTYEDFLEKAMSDLQLSVTKSSRKTCQITTSFCETPGSAYHTPSGVITRSMSAKLKASGSARQLDYESTEDTPKQIKTSAKKTKTPGVKLSYESDEEDTPKQITTPKAKSAKKTNTSAKAKAPRSVQQLKFGNAVIDSLLKLQNTPVKTSLTPVPAMSELLMDDGEMTPQVITENAVEPEITEEETTKPENTEEKAIEPEITEVVEITEEKTTEPEIAEEEEINSEITEVQNDIQSENAEESYVVEEPKEKGESEVMEEKEEPGTAEQIMDPIVEKQQLQNPVVPKENQSKLIKRTNVPVNSRLVSKPRVLVYHNRRPSLKSSKPGALPTGQRFVSMAEAVSKFHNSTPQRFRTNNKNQKPDSLAPTKRTAMQLTHAVSPVLRSKSRTRPATALSTEQREIQEAEKFRNQTTKTIPVRKSTFKKLEPPKLISKKPATVPQPFHLTEVKKQHNATAQITQPNAKPIPKPKLVTKQKPETKRDTAEIKYVPKTKLVMKQKPETKHDATVHDAANKNHKVQMVVGTDDAGVTVKEVQVLHFGIPIKQKKAPKTTTTAAFSFEQRTKEFQERKEQKIKHLLEETSKKLKSGFHATPVPKANKSCASSIYSSRENVTPKPSTTPQPFSFEERNKLMLKKKDEQLAKFVSEEERKARVFRANPVPNFKPMLVRGLSRDNLKKKVEGNTLPKKTGPLKAVHVEENKADQQKPKMPEIKAAIVPTKIPTSKVELNTDKRAKERREFDEKLKQKELAEEEMRKRKKEEETTIFKAENEVLRKTREVKAMPMPEFKPVKILKSEKPLTDPQSPAWTHKKH